MALDPKYKAVVFDMDGTFMKTKVDYGRLSDVVFHELLELGVPENAIKDRSGSKTIVTDGIKWLKENGSEEQLKAIDDRISKKTTEVELENVSMAVPFDGALDVIALLKNKGYKTGILTRGGRKYAERALSMFNLTNELDAIVARDDFPEEDSKPSPKAMHHMADALNIKAEEILYLGDHIFDWMTARDSGAGFYGVLTGGYSEEDWKNAGDGIAVLNSVKDLLDII
jgi:HAD superfamily hydrolase (TIGR01549 family)